MEKHRRFIQASAGLLVVVLSVPGVSRAGGRAAQWGESLSEIEVLILEKQFEEAVPKIADLEEDMLSHIVDGPRVEQTLAKVAALYALALAGTGDLQHAAWKWKMALELHPQYSEVQLSTKGPAGLELKRALAESQRPEIQGSSTQEVTADPRLITRVHPWFPESQRHGKPVEVALRVVIGKDGVPRDPEVIQRGRSPILLYLALEAVCQWRFSPAQNEHGPIAVIYPLTVQFKTH